MSLDFTALDFETANGFRGSPCSVGVVRVRAGEPVERAHWMMRPPRGFDRFDPRNVMIHGIRPEQVARAPRFAEVFDQLLEFVGEDPLVAHNAGFDLGVIESALEVSGRDVPALDYACSLVLARKGYDLPSYALPRAAEEAGHPVARHHDALADAEACAWIVIDIERRSRTDGTQRSLDALLADHGLQRRHLTARVAGDGQLSRATRQAHQLGPVFDSTVELPHEARMPDLMHWPDEGPNPDPAPDADPSHPLFGHQVVFTGNLGMPRQQAKARAAACGARPASRVGAATTLLVVGDGFRSEDLARGADRPVGGAVLHRKTREALARRARGQRVELISEPEFLQMLDGNWPELSR
ncbi:exonuclease domain-containing protein [Micrococcus terreus]|uniref:exonuclease domain-containing protein n=1 Tax=Micrococcus terreus TaxID=574650 RepID=UPI00254E827E|nr:exonuclease domain-containing protein [Micrococcus terreus]MDK7700942.1 exonuclease domain-containing protein [Micrococcus terreus]WOO97974.1 exonuclease domain-containing protein [Micrococcus terreus]